MAPDPSTGELTPTPRTTLRRKSERGAHDRATIDAILDEGLVAHVGLVGEHGPIVLPMAYARVGDVVYLHGAVANGLLRQAAAGAELCVTVTLLDGLVLARSAFHHSMNYRCVVLVGRARRVQDPDEMRAASAALLDHVAPGRSRDARPPNDAELRATMVVALPIAEGAAKVRRGGPVDDDADLGLAVWAGQLPVRLTAGRALPDADDGAPEPEYLRAHRLGAEAP